jgi:hypothetical protein
VLVAGGFGLELMVLENSQSSPELYESGTGNWTAAAALGTTRIDHTATLLASGKVLVAGGFNIIAFNAVSSAELYNPRGGPLPPRPPVLVAPAPEPAVVNPR